MMDNSIQNFTLYVDGACRGNPGIGGWGALIINQHGTEQELFGGEADTTNNRMELTAALEGIRACPADATLSIHTDSTYVQKGMTEWMKGWKAKNWKGVKNPDLWQKLDDISTHRQISWHWIKGHAGHAGNERADQLANLGADSVTEKKNQQPEPHTTKEDWLLDDPFGLNDTAEEEQYVDIDTLASESTDTDTDAYPTTTKHPHINITPTTHPQNGERLLILDTETTGFYYQDSDRIIEIGAIEMINRRLTGSSIHIYINPEKDVGDSENIHGLSNAFLADKPVFNDIAQVLHDYLKGAEIVAHNATFDMNFLDMEFERAGLGKLSEVCNVTDTLAIAKRKHPGQKNSLDMLVKRYEIPPRDRTFHGALLDAEILADVYLVMTGGQVSLDIDSMQSSATHTHMQTDTSIAPLDIPLILPHEHELQAHHEWMEKYKTKNNHASLFEQVAK